MSTTSKSAYLKDLTAILDVAYSEEDPRYICDVARNRGLCGYKPSDYYGTHAVYCKICPLSRNNFESELFAALYADEMERQGLI